MAEKEEQQRTQTVEDAAVAKSSPWNTNSSHWEEKQLTAWCISTLQQQIAAAKIKLLDESTELSFFNVKVQGEANLSYKGKKKILFYDLFIDADWSATARDKQGNFLASSTGSVSVRDFSDDCTFPVAAAASAAPAAAAAAAAPAAAAPAAAAAVSPPSVSFTGDGQLPPQQRIDAAAKTEGKQQLLLLLSSFAQEIKNKA